MSIERTIAIRYLRAKRRDSLVSLISVLAVGGVGLGVAALIVVLAVLNGFETNLKNKLLGLSPHVSIFRSGGNLAGWPELVAKIKTVPGVRTVLPFIQGQALLASGSGATGVVLMGLDPAATAEAGFFETLNVSPAAVANLTRQPMIANFPGEFYFPEFAEDEEFLPDDPAPANGATEEGATEEGVAEEGATEEGATEEGVTEERATEDGATEAQADRKEPAEAGSSEPSLAAPAAEPPEPDPERPIMLGRELAMSLGVGTLSTVRVISPFGRVTPLGQRAPLTRYFKVAGTFQAHYYDFDSKLAFTTLEEAASLLGLAPGEVTYLEVKVDDIYKADLIRREIVELLGPDYWGRDWMRMNLSLFSALKLERTAMFVILTLIILVAAFNIASTLIMMVAEKTRDIAILKAMGATSAQVRRIFTLQGLLVGLVGTVGGLAFGIALCLLLKRYEFITLPAEIYLMSSLPVELRWPQATAIAVVSMAISYLATVYPAKRAASYDPVEALRYE
ncbi:MAG: ABC transporter permease [Deltaproteobacteria bacterium]|jgi:lipoprotein-releasing system permease protein|nr:ABC transporter permease [Deltaproteobacteria bacterium]